MAFLRFAAVIAAAGCLAFAGCTSNPSARNQNARINSDAEFENGASQPPNAKTMYAMARILVGQGRDRDALNLLGQVVQKYPGYLPAYNEIAGIYVRSDRLGDAIHVLSAGLKQAPQSGVLHNNMGMCWLLKQDYAKAAESFHQAVLAVPDDRIYKANYAVALGLAGRDVEAAESYHGVITSPEAVDNLVILRKARAAAGQTSKSSPSPTTQSASVR